MIPDALRIALDAHRCPGVGEAIFDVVVMRHQEGAGPQTDWHLEATCGRCGAEVCGA